MMRTQPSFFTQLLIFAIAWGLLTGCSSSVPKVPDMTPIGMGLKFIGIGLVVMALVFVLGEDSD